MAFREKTAWISIFVTVLIWGSYFGGQFPGLLSAQPNLHGMLGDFLYSVFLAVLLQIVLMVVIAIMSPKDAEAPADERERLIEFRSTTIAYHVLTVTLVVAVLGAPALSLYHAHKAGITPNLGAAAIPMANGVLLALVLAEIAKYVAQLVQFRRGTMA
jgi:sterol desaturase/sphingolipid hydroxylase (fatty acid hydroxylase superfamily)